mmetsp:Transcript_34510/g.107178  ORF Transcript_34510/g.107178 Transcript_34510/m.107178 type:complete len:512 (-) Transcript_34510:27-1562(-)
MGGGPSLPAGPLRPAGAAAGVRQVEAVALDLPRPLRSPAGRHACRGRHRRALRLRVQRDVELPFLDALAQLEARVVLAEPGVAQDPEVVLAEGAARVEHHQLAHPGAARGADGLKEALSVALGLAHHVRHIGGRRQGEVVAAELEGELREHVQVAAGLVQLLHGRLDGPDHLRGRGQQRGPAVDEGLAAPAAAQGRPAEVGVLQGRPRQLGAPLVGLSHHGHADEEVLLVVGGRVVPDDEAVGAVLFAHADGELRDAPSVQHGQLVAQLDGDLDHPLRVVHGLLGRDHRLVVVGGQVLDVVVDLLPDLQQRGLRGPHADDGLERRVLEHRHLRVDDLPEHLSGSWIGPDGDLLEALVAPGAAAAVVLRRGQGAGLVGVAETPAVVGGDGAGGAVGAEHHQLEGAGVDDARDDLLAHLDVGHVLRVAKVDHGLHDVAHAVGMAGAAAHCHVHGRLQPLLWRIPWRALCLREPPLQQRYLIGWRVSTRGCHAQQRGSDDDRRQHGHGARRGVM